jgi:hypothetical protein
VSVRERERERELTWVLLSYFGDTFPRAIQRGTHPLTSSTSYEIERGYEREREKDRERETEREGERERERVCERMRSA